MARAAQPVAGRQSGDGLAHRTDRAHRLHQAPAITGRIAADADRNLADAECIQHGELAGRGSAAALRHPAKSGSRVTVSAQLAACAACTRTSSGTIGSAAHDGHQFSERDPYTSSICNRIACSRCTSTGRKRFNNS